jgi:hypothetical protein
VSPERLLRVGAVYHALLGGTLLLLPGDLFAALGLEVPAYWLFVCATGAGICVAAASLELARRRPQQREGLLLAVMLGNVTGMAVVLGFVVWEELPRLLLGPGFASGLWAWLLWNVYSPEPEEPS